MTGSERVPGDRQAARTHLIHDASGFQRFWAARCTSALGTGVAAVALLWIVSAGQDAGLAVGVVAAAELAAPSVLAPVLGPLVDRTNRRTLLIGSVTLRIATTLSLPFAYGYGGVGAVVPLALAQGMLSVLSANAASAALPELVGKERLATANAMLVTGTHVALVVGSALGGVLVGLSRFLPFAVDALTYLLAASLLATVDNARFGVRCHLGLGAVVGAPYWRELSEGATAFRSLKAVRTLAGIGTIATLGFAPASVALVVLVRASLGGSGAGYGAVRAAAAIGLASGAQVAPWLARRLNSSARAMSAGYCAMGMLTVILGVVPNVASALPVALLRSGSNGLLGVPSTVLLQRHVPPELRGRVFTLLGALEEAPRLAILPIAGLLADDIGPRLLFIFMALPILAASVIAIAARRLLDAPGPSPT